LHLPWLTFAVSQMTLLSRSEFNLIFGADQTTLFSTSTSTLKRIASMIIVNFEQDLKE